LLTALRAVEPGADRVKAILRLGRSRKAAVLLSFMTRFEVLYRVTVSEGDGGGAPFG